MASNVASERSAMSSDLRLACRTGLRPVPAAASFHGLCTSFLLYGHELLRSLTTCNSALRRSSVRAHCYKTKRILDRSSGAQHSSRTLSRGICAQDNRACSCLTRLELQETGEKRIFGMWTGTSAAFTQRIRVCDLILSAHHQRLW